MFCVSGFGGVPNPSKAGIDMVVASTIMFGIAFGLTWAPAPYTTAAEMSSSAVSIHLSCSPGEGYKN
jgi:hypothetical protein